MRIRKRRHARWLMALVGIALLHLLFVSTAAAFLPGGFWRWQGIGFGPGFHAHGCRQPYRQPVEIRTIAPYGDPRMAPTQPPVVGSW